MVASSGMFIRLAVPALWAIAAFTWVSQDKALTEYFFPSGLAGEAEHADQAMPAVLGAIVPSGLLGLLVAGLLAAFMSTHDSYLLCWSSVISRDVVGPLARSWKGRELTDKQEILTTRVSVVAIGCFLLLWGIWYELPDSVWDYMAVSGTIYLSGAAPALVGGIYWRRASTAGAWAALVCGLFAITGLFIAPLQDLLDAGGIRVRLTPPGVGLLNFALCSIMFVVFSLAVPDSRGDENADPTEAA